MKNLFRILCGLSIVGIATVACNKEIEKEVAPETPVISKHSVKVKAGFSEETKTVMLSSGDQTKWTAGDDVNMHFFENGIAPDPNDLAVSLNAEETELTIMAEFANTSATKYVYTSILASNLDAEGNATIPAAQDILDGTFDPDADVLVAKPEEFAASQSLEEFTMQYKRVVAVNKIKIKGLTAGDKISSVTISSNKPFLGSYSMTNDAWTNSGNELNLNATSEPITVPTSGEVSLWFITAPVSDATLSIYVVTDNHQYEKDFTKTISFAANTVTSFATTVAASEVGTGGGDFVKFTSTAGIEAGEYVLVHEDNSSPKIFTGVSSSSYGIGENVTIDENKILNENVSASSVLTVAAASEGTAWVIKQGSSFFNWSSGNSLTFATSESNNTRWTISFDNSGNATIANVSDSNRKLQWNSSNPRFACYTSSQAKVQLYKREAGGLAKSALAKPIVTLERNATKDGIIVSWADVNKAGSYTVTCTGQEPKTIDQGIQTAEFTNLDPSNYTVTVTANPANADRNTATTSDEVSIEIYNYNLVAPTMSFVAGDDNIVVSWNAIPNASSYTYCVLKGEEVVVAETTIQGTTFTASNLADNTEYTFKIKSIGEGDFISSDYAVQQQSTLELKPGSKKTYSISSSTSAANSFNKLFGGTNNSAVTVNHVTNKQITLNSDSWFITTTGNGTVIYASGQQLGAKASSNVIRDITSLTMSTAAYTDRISNVTVNTQSNGETTLSLYVNDVLIDTKDITSAATDYTFTLSELTKGSIKLVWNNSLASKSITLASITINND